MSSAFVRLGRRRLMAPAGLAAAGVFGSWTAAHCFTLPKELAEQSEETDEVTNWSGTHSVTPSAYFMPESSAAVGRLVSAFHAAGGRLRVVGSKLSPNGMGLSSEAMLDMVQCSAVLSVDAETKQATVQAGARVSDVVEALRPHGLTLQNYASIAEQQIGGFLQVGAHGTGATVPPVDEQVVRMVLHTPALGEMTLSPSSHPRLFELAKVSLGWLGVVSEVTIQCVDAHKLLQHTFVETREGVRQRHLSHLKHQHMRYMWIPHTDTVVVVACDPTNDTVEAAVNSNAGSAAERTAADLAAAAPLRELLLKSSEKRGTRVSKRDADSMNFAQLRDALLALAPLDREHVIAVNEAEAKYWHQAQGYRVDWSDKILGFDCGGQQWVSEVAMPCGTLAKPDGRDLNFMSELLGLIEASDIPTPAPIEQRWTRRSTARMSPAHSEGEDDLHTWVGIIMYLPPDNEEQRAAITKRFWEYNAMCRQHLWPRYGCHQHWAKIELPDSESELATMRARLAERFPLDELHALKKRFDPRGVLGNTLVDTLLLPESELKQMRAKGAGPIG